MVHTAKTNKKERILIVRFFLFYCVKKTRFLLKDVVYLSTGFVLKPLIQKVG